MTNDDLKVFLKAKILRAEKEIELVRKSVDFKMTDLNIKDEKKRMELFLKFMTHKDKVTIEQTVINVCSEILKELGNETK